MNPSRLSNLLYVNMLSSVPTELIFLEKIGVNVDFEQCGILQNEKTIGKWKPRSKKNLRYQGFFLLT